MSFMPAALKREVWATYRDNQELDKRPSPGRRSDAP